MVKYKFINKENVDESFKIKWGTSMKKNSDQSKNIVNVKAAHTSKIFSRI